MKEKIYTIPLWDAFRNATECPLCEIEAKIEKKYIDNLFSEHDAIIMDTAFNKEITNYTFCNSHFKQLYEYPDKLGLALIVHRLLYSEISQLKRLKLSENLKRIIDLSLLARTTSIIFKNSKNKIKIDKHCYLCDKINNAMGSYIDIMIDLWSNDEEFKVLFNKSKGLCQKHFNYVINHSKRIFSNKKRKIFISACLTNQLNNMYRMNEELEWFLKKLDFQFKDEPWKSSKDALVRSISKITGKFL
ncbi:MAG: hypothetical protein HPY74_01450 [Firmicutes bacterium]|nr:hypothetical protein [Bacillota bacterium]